MRDVINGLGDRLPAVGAEKIDDNRANDRKGFDGSSITGGGGIFFENSVFGPMEAILNLPMLLNQLSEKRSLSFEGGDVEHCLFKGLLPSPPTALNLDNTFDANPLRAHVSWGRKDTDDSFNVTTVVSLTLTLTTHRGIALKGFLQRSMEFGLILLDSDEEVISLLNNGFYRFF